jgi:AraC family transcriptional regulator of adaptative response/methylated-DNA-[protein]-cysteine methyltransferase
MSQVCDARLFAAVGETDFGLVLLVADDQRIRRLRFGDDEAELWAELRGFFPNAMQRTDNQFRSRLQRVCEQIDRPDPEVSFRLDPSGTPFQRSVWRALMAIPFGATATYSEIASRIGRPTAMRAVANACGDNPIAVLVPCHRVVRSDGGLGGYRWGLERKRALLSREEASLAKS